MSRAERVLSVAKSFSPHLWNGRHEATLLKLGPLFTSEQAAEAAEKKRTERLSEVGEIVAASDALLRTDAAVERVAEAISWESSGIDKDDWAEVGAMSIATKESFRDLARAAIDALLDGEA